MVEKKSKVAETKKDEAKPVEAKPVEVETKKAETKKTEKTKAVKKQAKKEAGKKAGKKTQKGKGAKKEKKVAKPQEAGKKRDRSFKVIYVDPKGEVVMDGRYCGAKPKQAACKALTGIYKIFKEENKPVDKEIKFGVYETTRGSKNKRYWYAGKKSELDDPIKLYQIPSTDGKKKYCSADKVEKLGGFSRVFGKDESQVSPAIVYNYTNEVKKVSDEKCKHLQNVQKVVEDEADSQTAGSKKKSSSKKAKEPKVAKDSDTKVAKDDKDAKDTKVAKKKEKSSSTTAKSGEKTDSTSAEKTDATTAKSAKKSEKTDHKSTADKKTKN